MHLSVLERTVISREVEGWGASLHTACLDGGCGIHTDNSFHRLFFRFSPLFPHPLMYSELLTDLKASPHTILTN